MSLTHIEIIDGKVNLVDFFREDDGEEHRRRYSIEEAMGRIEREQQTVEMAILAQAALDSRELSDEEKAKIADEAEQRREASSGLGPLDPPPPA